MPKGCRGFSYMCQIKDFVRFHSVNTNNELHPRKYYLHICGEIFNIDFQRPDLLNPPWIPESIVELAYSHPAGYCGDVFTFLQYFQVSKEICLLTYVTESNFEEQNFCFEVSNTLRFSILSHQVILSILDTYFIYYIFGHYVACT